MESEYQRKISIIGGGNGGHAYAFTLAKLGFDVCLYQHPDHPRTITALNNANCVIKCTDSQEHATPIYPGAPPAGTQDQANIALATHDIQAAVEFSINICFIVPSFAQDEIFTFMLPHLTPQHFIFSMPGNLGSLSFAKILRDNGKESLLSEGLMLGETSSIPWAVRLDGPAEIKITGTKIAMEFGCFPAHRMEQAFPRVKFLLPIMKLTMLSDVFQCVLGNLNGGHVPNLITNVGLSQTTALANVPLSFEEDGVCAAVSELMEIYDTERGAVANAVGWNDWGSFCTIMRRWYGSAVNYETIFEFAQNSVVHNSLPNNFPRSEMSRYITEDTPFNLVPIASFARLFEVQTPIIDSLIAMASAVCGQDFWAKGRHLENLGLAGLDREALLAYLQTGSMPSTT